MSKQQLLSLSTLDPERPVIEIDGQNYECAVAEDFGVIQHTRLERLIRKAQQLRDIAQAETDEDAEERAQEAEDACRKAVAIIMPTLPAAILAKLRLTHLFGIMKAYTDFIQAVGKLNQPEPLPTLTGDNLSPDSSDSTADTPPTG